MNKLTIEQVQNFVDHYDKSIYKQLNKDFNEIINKQMRPFNVEVDKFNYKPLTEELLQRVIDQLEAQNKKDLEGEAVYYYYLNGWQRCTGEIYRKITIK